MKSILTQDEMSVCKPSTGADIYLAGDSTCANYSAEYAPMNGWGQMLQEFCRPGIRVYNLAICGSSTKSFQDVGAWDKLLAAVKPGDFVVIQFGHNDQKSDNPDRYADVKVAYPENLKRFIADVRARGCKPMLVTSIVRCTFSRGKLQDGGLRVYCDAAIAVAQSEKVPVIDLNRISESKINGMGESRALEMYMYTSTLKGHAKTDKSHLKKSGAEVFAGWFIGAVKTENLPIAECFK